MTAILLVATVFAGGVSAAQQAPQGPPAVKISEKISEKTSERTSEKIDEKIASMLVAVRAARMRTDNAALVAFGTRHILSSTTDRKRGTGAARDWLQQKLESFIPMSGGRLTVKREVFRRPASRLRQNVEIVNIVATLPGITDPGRVYVVGGHYDSRNRRGTDGERDAPGANDDGSGTCVVIEACRVMCQHQFAATIQFVCYDGEEQGLLGSESHAKALAAAEVNVDGMITNDIVGNTLGMDGERRRDYLRCFSYSATGNDSRGRSLARAVTYAAKRHVGGDDFRVKLIYRGDRYGRGGDHKSFHRRGYPAVRFTEPREDYSRQHQDVTTRDGKPYGDLTQFMDFDYMVKVAAVNVSVLAHLASAPPAPRRAAASGARRSYDTNIYWSKVGRCDRFEVVWRETTVADWQGAQMAGELEVGSGRRWRGMIGDVLKGVCLDDVVVGVRSVGPDGSRSRVVTPPEPDSFNQRRLRTGNDGGRNGRRR